MSITIAGVVKDGVVIPSTPLPEGAMVEIHLDEATGAVPLELQEELAAWQRASAHALELVERLADEGTADEAR